MTDDDGLEIAEMHVATRAHLAEQGFDVLGAYNVTMVRADGELVSSECDAASMVRNLIDVLNPPRIELMTLAAITPATLH